MIDSFPPGLLLILGALVIPLIPRALRGVTVVIVPVVGLLHLIYVLPAAGSGVFEFLGQPLEVVRDCTVGVNKPPDLSFLFGILFHIAAIVGGIYALHVKDTLQQSAALFYAGSALLVVYAGDLLTLFVGWELLAVSSAFFIWARRTEHAARAGMRYLLIQLSSGLLLLAGILVRVSPYEGGSLAFEQMELGSLSTWLIFLGFGLKAGFPLLHNWLTDGYPEATGTGTVFLSGFTTKVAIYALARGFSGTEELVWIGVVMTFFPIFYAVIENDLRRVLSYSMINQLGFMVVGIGIGTPLAINGAVAHAFNDVFFKGLLFMSMGAVLLRTGTTKGSELGGLYKSMPWTTGFCLIGAASISAVPLFSGFVSKTMIVVAVMNESLDAAQATIVNPSYVVVWFFLLFASAGVLEHAGIKIPFFAFFAHDSGRRPKEAPLNMRVAMGIAAGLCILNGALPWVLLYPLLPFDTGFSPFSAFKIITQLQLLFWASLAVMGLMLLGRYPPELRSTNLEFDWFYRRGVPLVVKPVMALLGRVAGAIQSLVLEKAPQSAVKASQLDYRVHVPRRWHLEISVLMVILMLLSYLLYNFIL